MVDAVVRRKQAELAGGLGALVLGLGLGALGGSYLREAVLGLIVTGAVLHGWGMWDKHRLERAQRAAPARWETLMYWLCWLLLAALALFLAATWG